MERRRSAKPLIVGSIPTPLSKMYKLIGIAKAILP